MNAPTPTHNLPHWLHPVAHAAHSGAMHVNLGDQNTHTHPDRSRQAAVMVLLAGDAQAHTLPTDASVLLTHRTPRMRSHSGQIAFPGGRVDAEDNSLVAAALRETKEETGVDANTITPFSTGEEIFIRATGYPVHPVWAYWHTPGGAHPASRDETDDVFQANLHHLINPESRLWVQHGPYTGPAFHYDGYLIWGFTASVLDAMISSSGWEQPWQHRPPLSLSAELAASRNGENLNF